MRPGPTAAPLLAVLVFLLASAAAAAGAEAPRAARPVDVAVLRPAEGDRVLAEAAARLRLELGASGLTSALVDGATDAFPDRVAFVREDGVATIDLVGTRPNASALHRRVGVPPAEGGDDPAVLALRAVELLRAIRLEVRRAPPAGPPPSATLSEVEDGAPARDVVRLSVGASLLEGEPGGGPATPGPTLSAGAAVIPHLSAVASFGGPYFKDLAPTPGGSAHTREELGHVGLRLEAGWERMRLHLLLGWGFHHLHAAFDTRGMPPGALSTEIHVRAPQDIWTPFVVIGAGASRRLWKRLGASVEASALLFKPTLDVVVDGRSTGKLGGPSLMQSVSMWVAFP